MERFTAIKEVIKQRGKTHGNYSLTRFQRWFYALKAVICLLLNRRKDCREDCIDLMAMWNCHRWESTEFVGYAYDWRELAVGIGVLSGWHYDIYANSSV